MKLVKRSSLNVVILAMVLIDEAGAPLKICWSVEVLKTPPANKKAPCQKDWQGAVRIDASDLMTDF